MVQKETATVVEKAPKVPQKLTTEVGSDDSSESSEEEVSSFIFCLSYVSLLNLVS